MSPNQIFPPHELLSLLLNKQTNPRLSNWVFPNQNFRPVDSPLPMATFICSCSLRGEGAPLPGQPFHLWHLVPPSQGFHSVLSPLLPFELPSALSAVLSTQVSWGKRTKENSVASSRPLCLQARSSTFKCMPLSLLVPPHPVALQVQQWPLQQELL